LVDLNKQSNHIPSVFVLPKSDTAHYYHLPMSAS